jgi:hypothetical protein
LRDGSLATQEDGSGSTVAIESKHVGCRWGKHWSARAPGTGVPLRARKRHTGRAASKVPTRAAPGGLIEVCAIQVRLAVLLAGMA